jgi:hypothetical protein
MDRTCNTEGNYDKHTHNLVRKREEKGSGNIGVRGKGKIKMVLKYTSFQGLNWNQLAQDRVQ